MTSDQETEWALFLQPRSPHGAHIRGRSVTVRYKNFHFKTTTAQLKTADLDTGRNQRSAAS